MKMGVRKPSIKKSISARTTGRATRSVKRAVNPMYGKKGMGWVNDPKKAAYNKVYNKTTVSAKDLVEGKSNKKNFGEDIICGIIGLIFILGIVFIIVFLLCLFL
ncbi:hypothetical protein [Clostridium thermobutyricum]|uniref:Phage protein n=1 Tax=Clostridium thermobutyricum DSM 4928 TaxID=1121339 RepID=A0A1V4SW99_9CLOT|nr:hypothetical protein CLTHE_11950 [Clostridium thermobutyricum DSM 4928]